MGGDVVVVWVTVRDTSGKSTGVYGTWLGYQEGCGMEGHEGGE